MFIIFQFRSNYFIQILMQQSWQSFEALKLTQQLTKSFPQSEQQTQQTNKYPSNFQFIVSMIGIGAGYASFWRFPYLIYKHGGAIFLIPYLCAFLFIGVPLQYFEGAIGQMYQRPLPFSLAKINRGLKGLGIAFGLSNLALLGFYNILLVYSLRLIFTSFNPNLPFKNESLQKDTYFQNVVLQKSDSISQFGGIVYHLFLFFIKILATFYYVINKGLNKSAKIKVLFILLYILSLLLIVRGVFLDGAVEGISYLLIPNLANLFKFQIWVDAVTQVFIQLSIGYGVAFNLSSLKFKKIDLRGTTFIIPASILVSSMLSALLVFIYLGHFYLRQLHLQGIQLSFQILLKALTTLPWPNLWLFVLASSLVFLGIDTLLACFEAFFCYLDDQFPQDQILIKIGTFQIKNAQIKKCLMVVLTLTFGIFGCSRSGIYYLGFFDQFCYSVPLSINAVLFLYMFTRVISIWQFQLQIMRFTKFQTSKWIRKILVSKSLMVLLVLNLILSVINQITLVNAYSMGYFLVGWLLSLYPYLFALGYWHIKKQKVWRITFQDIKAYSQIENK